MVRVPSRRAAAAVLAGLLVLVLVPVYAASMRKVWDQGSERAGWTRLERELAPARQAELDPRVFLLARRLLGPDATYAVVTGDRASRRANRGAAGFAQYLLLPRRRVDRAQDADWVLVYGAGLQDVGVGLGRIVRVSPGVFLARVRS